MTLQVLGSDLASAERASRTTILVAEGHAGLERELRVNLQARLYDVIAARTGREAMAMAASQPPPDAVILDLGLPDIDSIEAIGELRRWFRGPIIVLSGRTWPADKVGALDVGADDYVTKPFSSRELVARIRAVLRRRGDAEEPVTSVMESGPVRMDVDRHVVTVRNSQVQLPLKEFELLEFLLRNAGRVLTRMQLIDRVWGSDYVGDTKTLDVHIKRLRAKIETDPAKPRHIVTVRGLGYKFEPVG